MLKGFRTYLVNILLTVMPIAEMTEMVDILPDGWAPYYVLGVAVANLYLRTITTTPPGHRS